MPYSPATAASSWTGRTVPISLFAHMTVARATRRGRARWPPAGPRGVRGRRRRRGGTRPGALVLAEPVDGVEDGVVLDGAGEDPGACRVGVAAGPVQALEARLSASVPPAVKTTSLGRAPMASAMVSRAPRRCGGRGGPRRAGRRRCRCGHLGGHRLDGLRQQRRGRRVIQVDHDTPDSRALGAPGLRAAVGGRVPRHLTLKVPVPQIFFFFF